MHVDMGRRLVDVVLVQKQLPGKKDLTYNADVYKEKAF